MHLWVWNLSRARTVSLILSSQARTVSRTVSGRGRYEDNSACIEWTNYIIGGLGRERSKHTDLRKHLAPQAVQDGEIHLYKVALADQLADLLTKSLSEPLLLRCVYGLLQLDADGFPT